MDFFKHHRSKGSTKEDTRHLLYVISYAVMLKDPSSVGNGVGFYTHTKYIRIGDLEEKPVSNSPEENKKQMFEMFKKLAVLLKGKYSDIGVECGLSD